MITKLSTTLFLILNLIFSTTLQATESNHESFEDLFQAAKDRHFMYEASKYRSQSARSSLADARAKYLPTVNFDANTNYLNKTDELGGVKSKSEMWNYNYAQFTVQIPLFSKALKQLNILKEYASKSTDLSQELLEQSFISNFVDIYGNMVMLETSRSLQLSIVDFLKKLIDEKVSNLEPNNPLRIQIEFTYHQVNLAFQSFLSQYYSLKNQVEGIIGMPLNGLYLNQQEDHEIEDSYPAPFNFTKEAKLKFAKELVEAALNSNGGNVQYKLAALQYEQAKDLAETAKLWDVNVYATASYGLSSLDNEALGGTLDSDSYSFGLGVSIPVFDGGYRHRVRESFYNMLSAQSQLKEQRKQLEIQAHNIVSELETSYRTNRAYSKDLHGRSLEKLLKEQQERFKDIIDNPNSDLAVILGELQVFQMSTQVIQLSSAAYKNIVVGNFKLKLFTGEIDESEITKLSSLLTNFVEFEKLDQSETESESESESED